MPSIRLHPASAARREAVLEAARAAFAGWERAWAMRPGGASLALDVGGAPPHDGAVACFGSDDGQVAIAGAPELAARWLLPAAVDAPDGTAARLGAEALADLGARLLGARVANPLALEPRRFEARAGAVALRLEIPRLALSLWIDGARALALHPRAPAAARRPLASRAEALAAVPVGLDCVLSLGHLPLADVIGLRPGDVVVSRAGLDSPFELRADDRRGNVAGRLARTTDGRKAFAAVHAPAPTASADTRNPAP